MAEIIDAVLNALPTLGGVALALVLLGLYVIFWPEKAEKVAGWCASLFSGSSRRAAQAKMKFKVQATINQAGTDLMQDAPDGLLTGALKVSFADTDHAIASLEAGEVVVTLRPSQHSENVVTALMTYLPKALVPEAREFVDRLRMEAVYLVVAKAMLATRDTPDGTQPDDALHIFFEQRLAPAKTATGKLPEKLRETDAIDLQGWLSRVLLWEYRHIGRKMAGGYGEPELHEETDALAEWLAELATPGNEERRLNFDRRFVKVGVIFVAIRGRLEEEGIAPYRRRAKRLLYKERFDGVYLMGRDDSIEAVRQVRRALSSDARIVDEGEYVYPLRSDFRYRTGINRERAIVVCLRRRQGGGEADGGDDFTDSPETPDETYLPRSVTARGRTQEPRRKKKTKQPA